MEAEQQREKEIVSEVATALKPSPAYGLLKIINKTNNSYTAQITLLNPQSGCSNIRLAPLKVVTEPCIFAPLNGETRFRLQLINLTTSMVFDTVHRLNKPPYMYDITDQGLIKHSK